MRRSTIAEFYRKTTRPGRCHCSAGRALATAAAFLVPLLSGGCAKQPPAASPAVPVAPAELTSEVVRGPVRMSVAISPSPARLSDEPKLTLTIESELGVEIEQPPFGEAVGDFLIRDFREKLPEVRGNRRITQQIYTLEPLLTGPSQIDPVMVEFTDNRPEGDGKQHRVETEALTLQVVSILGKDAPSLSNLKGFDEPVPLPSDEGRGWLFAIAGSAAVVLLAGLAYLRWRSRPVTAVVLTPREQAARELDALLQSDAATHDVKGFYVELTGIVRRYIERTTGIHAPEQTTEEFLREVGSGQVFTREERQRLQDFLEAADLVKFAGHQPHEEDREEALRRARMFVGLAGSEVTV